MGNLVYLKVTANNFLAGVQIEGSRCVNTSTMLRYMVGWSEERVRKHLKRRKWKTEEMDPEKFGRSG